MWVWVLTVSARLLLCFEMGVFLFCFRNSSDIPTKMNVPVSQGQICLDDRELKYLTLQQATQQKNERSVNTQRKTFIQFLIQLRVSGENRYEERQWEGWLRLRCRKDQSATL